MSCNRCVIYLLSCLSCEDSIKFCCISFYLRFFRFFIVSLQVFSPAQILLIVQTTDIVQLCLSVFYFSSFSMLYFFILEFRNLLTVPSVRYCVLFCFLSCLYPSILFYSSFYFLFYFLLLFIHLIFYLISQISAILSFLFFVLLYSVCFSHIFLDPSIQYFFAISLLSFFMLLDFGKDVDTF